MTDAVAMFLQMSLQGAVLIAALLALRTVFARRIAPGVLYALWLIPAARLLIPGSIESAFSFQNLVSEEAAQRARVVMEQPTAVTLPVQNLSPVTAAPGTVPEGAQVSVQSTAFLSLPDILFLVWFVGFCAVLVFMIWKNMTFSRRLKADRVEVEAECPLPVYLSEAIASPCLCGLVRPAIYVDERTLQSQQALDLVLRHEMGHYRAGDRFWALLRLSCCAVHWFNPLVWMAAAVSLQDCERACDARVLKKAGEAERQTYGVLLLSYLQRPEKQHLLRAASSMGGGKGALRGRIALIARSPEMKKAAVTALALCVALTCLVACTTRTQAGALGQLQRRIAPEQLILCSGEQSTVTGRTLINVLSDKEWTEITAEDLFEDDTGGVLCTFAGTCVDAEDASWLLSVERCTVQVPLDDLGLAQGDPCYVGRIVLPGGEETCYVMPEEDTDWFWAVQRLDADEKVFHSTLPESGEIVMVRTGPAMGMERHYFFFTDNGTDYAPIYSDLDEQYARVAENMLFISRDVGFVSFRYENAETAPDLFRTADGGKTWQRVELPMGDITTESGYSGMHVTEIAFEDENSGTLTVGMNHTGTSSGLATVFTTTDGGETWWAVTSGGPDVPGVHVTLYVGNDNADGLVRTQIDLAELTPENLVDALMFAGGIPENTKVLSFAQSADGMQLTLNLSGHFAAGVRQMGTAGESMMLGSLVNTFLEAYGAQSLVLQIEGKPLETGHNIYEEPFGYFIFDESGVSWENTAVDNGVLERPGNDTGLVEQAIFLDAGEAYQMRLRGITTKPEWSTSDPNIAKVDARGLVTAVHQGTAYITVTWDGGTHQCAVTVGNDPVAVAAQETAYSFDYDAQTREMTFQVSTFVTRPENLSIHIAGRQEMEDGQYMSRHFLENETWKAGRIYTFALGEGEFSELTATVSYREDGYAPYEVTRDLIEVMNDSQ